MTPSYPQHMGVDVAKSMPKSRVGVVFLGNIPSPKGSVGRSRISFSKSAQTPEPWAESAERLSKSNSWVRGRGGSCGGERGGWGGGGAEVGPGRGQGEVKPMVFGTQFQRAVLPTRQKPTQKGHKSSGNESAIGMRLRLQQTTASDRGPEPRSSSFDVLDKRKLHFKSCETSDAWTPTCVWRPTCGFLPSSSSVLPVGSNHGKPFNI